MVIWLVYSGLIDRRYTAIARLDCTQLTPVIHVTRYIVRVSAKGRRCTSKSGSIIILLSIRFPVVCACCPNVSRHSGRRLIVGIIGTELFPAFVISCPLFVIHLVQNGLI